MGIFSLLTSRVAENAHKENWLLRVPSGLRCRLGRHPFSEELPSAAARQAFLTDRRARAAWGVLPGDELAYFSGSWALNESWGGVEWRIQ